MSLNSQFFYKRNRLQQIKGFYYTVKNGSVSGAAQEMNLTQSAVTIQIKSLERDLKTQLFAREGKKLILSTNGHLFYSHIVSHIQNFDDLFESFSKKLDNQFSEIVSIGSNHAVISYVLPKYLKKFKELNPHSQFRIKNLSKQECFDRLLKKEIDMLIYPMNSNEIPVEFEFIPIVKYQPILLVKKSDKLAKKNLINLTEISKNREIIRIDPKLITLPAFEEIIRAHGFKTSFEFEMSDWEILKKFVRADLGIAIISNIVLEGEESQDLVGKVLTNYFPEMVYGIITRKGQIIEGLAKDFIDLMLNEKLLGAQNCIR